MIKDPVDLIFSWYIRGWGGRFTTDPRGGCFTYQSNVGITPWYNLYIDGEYNELKPMDRIIHLIEGNYLNTFKNYNEMEGKKKKQILWLVLEEFVTNTEENIVRIENYLGVKRTKYTPKQLKIERCPRVLNKEERKKKLELIKSKASANAFRKIKGQFKLTTTILV